MAQKLLKRKPRKVAPKKAQVDETGRAGAHPALSPLRGSLRSEDMRTPSAVLVGTYKEGQLSWIKRHGIYNYPVKEEDFSRVDGERGMGNGERGTGNGRPPVCQGTLALRGCKGYTSRV